MTLNILRGFLLIEVEHVLEDPEELILLTIRPR